LSRRREREDYAPTTRAESRRQRKREELKTIRVSQAPPEKEPWEKREEQLERKRRKRRPRREEEEPEEVYEEEDYEGRALVEPREKRIIYDTRRVPSPPSIYEVEDEGLRQYQIQRAKYGPIDMLGREAPPTVIKGIDYVHRGRFFEDIGWVTGGEIEEIEESKAEAGIWGEPTPFEKEILISEQFDTGIEDEGLEVYRAVMGRTRGLDSKREDEKLVKAFGLRDQDLDDIKEPDLLKPTKLTAEDKMLLTQTGGAFLGQLALGFQGIEKWYAQHLRTPIQVATGRRRGIAEELREEGKFFEAWGWDISAHFAKGGQTFLDVLTTPIRPSAAIGAVTSPIVLAREPEARKYLITRYKGDPHGALSTLLGGYLGGRTLGFGLEKMRQAKLRFELRKYTEEDWLPYESTHPEPVSAIYDTWALVEEKAEIADDFLGQHIVKGGYTLDDAMQTLDSKWLKSKGYLRTGHDTIPMQIPKGMGTTQKVLKQVRRGIDIRTTAWSRYAYGLPLGGKGKDFFSELGLLGLASTLRQEDYSVEKFRDELLITEKTTQEATKFLKLFERGEKERPMIRPETTEIPRIIRMVGHTQKTPQLVWPMTTSDVVQDVIQGGRQTQVTIQKLLQTPKVTPISKIIGEPRWAKRKPVKPPRRKTKKRRREWDILFGYEQRVYGVKPPKELLNLIGGGFKSRKTKRKTRSKRKSGRKKRKG